jgi:hypothetical protein
VEDTGYAEIWRGSTLLNLGSNGREESSSVQRLLSESRTREQVRKMKE